MILDASAIIAFARNEAKAPTIRTILQAGPPLAMSHANLAEVLMLLHRQDPARADSIVDELIELGVELVATDLSTTLLAASVRRFYPLNSGDTFCYALAKRRGEPILTLDADFAKTDAALVPLNGE